MITNLQLSILATFLQEKGQASFKKIINTWRENSSKFNN